MADLSEYTTTQQKVIREIAEADKGFHSTFLIADTPFYGMAEESDSGEQVTKKNIECSLIVGNTSYTLNIFYSSEQDCWFYKFAYLGEEIRGIVHYNTILNARGETAFAILNDNVDDSELTASLPYSNVLVLGK